MRLFLALLLSIPAFGALSTISDTLLSASGQPPITGSIIVSWPTFTYNSGVNVVAKGSYRINVINGAVLVSLQPTDVADQNISTPGSVYYSVTYNIYTSSPAFPVQFQEQWNVPTSGILLKLKDVRTIASGGGTFPLSISFSNITSGTNSIGTFVIESGSSLYFNGGWLRPPESTVGGLPSAAATTGRVYIVTNGTAAGDCTVGGGSASTWCRSNGSIWVALGSGSSGANVVFNNQSNTYSTGAQDFGAATSLKIPTFANAAPTLSGLISYDSTNNLYHFGRNGLSLTVALFQGSFTNGDCLSYLSSTGSIISAGAACGTGGSVTWKSGGSTIVAGSIFNIINLDGILKTTANNPAGTFELQLAVDRATTPTKISSGTATLGTSAIASTACATVVTVAAVGTLTTDIISWGLNADITAVTGYAPVTSGGLSVYVFPTANNINVKVCNPTTSSVTPGAITLNWMSQR